MHGSEPKKSLVRRTPQSVWLLVTLLIVAAFYIGIRTGGLSIPMNRLPWDILVPAAAGFALMHSWLLLGPQRALALLACGTLVGFAFEWVGETTGWPFSPYHYTDVLGWKIGGRIPLLIPLAWYMMFYPSYIIANMLGEGGPLPRRTNWVQIVWLSLLSAFVMTAWDLTMDPVMSYQGPDYDANRIAPAADVGTPAWVWAEKGSHFGVPLQNYFGWMLTSFTVFLIYRFWETRLEPAPRHGMCSRVMISMPIGVYTAMALVDTFLGYPEIAGLRLISPFAMGIPAFFAAYQLFANRTDLPLWPTEPHDGAHPAFHGTGPVHNDAAEPCA